VSKNGVIDVARGPAAGRLGREQAAEGNRMTIYGIAIAVLLIFPWSLVGLIAVGATSAAVKRRVARPHRGRVMGAKADSSLDAPRPENLAVSMSRTSEGTTRCPDVCGALH
jgi:hypothetical protein